MLMHSLKGNVLRAALGIGAMLMTPALVSAFPPGGHGGGGHGGGGHGGGGGHHGGGNWGGGGGNWGGGGYRGGYGSGYRGGYGGYGYGGNNFGSGFATGLGFGLGSRLGYGGLGYGYGGYGGYGYPGYGYGGFASRYGYGLGGYGYGGYGGYSYPYYGGYGYTSPGYSTTTPYIAGYGQDTSTTTPQQPISFAEKMEVDFRNRDYQAAVYDGRHAVTDMPNNGFLKLMLGQALFATGAYEESAQMTQQAMQAMPQDQWGVIPQHYRELYSSIGDYTNQLKALEAATKAKPDDANLSFLLGFHYLYLGYPAQANRALDRALASNPNNKAVQDLQAAAAGRASGTAAVPVPPTPQ